MAMSFTQLQDVKARIIRDLAGQQQQLETAKGSFTQIKNSLTGFENTYAGWATEVNTLATANPSDAAVMALKAERDRFVAEFSSTKVEAIALETAVAAVV